MKTKEEKQYRVEARRSPLGDTGDYNSWVELVCPTFILECNDPDVEIDEVQEIADKLNAPQSQQEWIPVEVRLPEEDVDVFTTVKFGDNEPYVTNSFVRSRTNRWAHNHGFVIAWKPITQPQPYNPKS